jgi:hypothetical protein
MELPSRSGTAGEGAGRNGGVEGLGRKTPKRDRRMGGPVRKQALLEIRVLFQVVVS